MCTKFLMMWQNFFCVPPMVHPDCTNGQPIICIANPDMYRVPRVFLCDTSYSPPTKNPNHAMHSLHPIYPFTSSDPTLKMGNKACQNFGSMGNEGTRRVKQRQLHRGFHQIIDYAHIKAIIRNTHLN